MRSNRLFLAVTSTALLLASTGCGDSSGAGGAGGSTTTTTTGKGSTATTTTSGTSTSTSTGGTGTPGDHLLISEIAVSPDAAVFIEIWNPTGAPVALDNYYVSDNATYTSLAAGQPWVPKTSNVGTDFLARFPAGSSIPADGVRVIGFDAGYGTTYPGKCPDFFMGTAPLTCGVANVPTMVPTEPTSITDASGLTNTREMVVLFTWDGNTANKLKDVDYVTWGAAFDPGATRVDKTAVAGYAPDTDPMNQKPAAPPMNFESIERCGLETGEKLFGGNGITGHDETSENMTTTFVIQAAPTPGTKNACL